MDLATTNRKESASKSASVATSAAIISVKQSYKFAIAEEIPELKSFIEFNKSGDIPDNVMAWLIEYHQEVENTKQRRFTTPVEEQQRFTTPVEEQRRFTTPVEEQRRFTTPVEELTYNMKNMKDITKEEQESSCIGLTNTDMTTASSTKKNSISDCKLSMVEKASGHDEKLKEQTVRLEDHDEKLKEQTVRLESFKNVGISYETPNENNLCTATNIFEYNPLYKRYGITSHFRRKIEKGGTLASNETRDIDREGIPDGNVSKWSLEDIQKMSEASLKRTNSIIKSKSSRIRMINDNNPLLKYGLRGYHRKSLRNKYEQNIYMRKINFDHMLNEVDKKSQPCVTSSTEKESVVKSDTVRVGTTTEFEGNLKIIIDKIITDVIKIAERPTTTTQIRSIIKESKEAYATVQEKTIKKNIEEFANYVKPITCEKHTKIIDSSTKCIDTIKFESKREKRRKKKTLYSRLLRQILIPMKVAKTVGSSASASIRAHSPRKRYRQYRINSKKKAIDLDEFLNE